MFKDSNRGTPFPTIPTTFDDYEEYKSVFNHLFQYEVFNRLLGRDDPVFAHLAKSEVEEDRQQYWTGVLGCEQFKKDVVFYLTPDQKGFDVSKVRQNDLLLITK